LPSPLSAVVKGARWLSMPSLVMKTPDVSTVEAMEYLSVDRFLADVVGAGALQSALNLGLIDRLLQDLVLSVRSFAAQANLDEDAAGLLLGMLRANAVIEECPGACAFPWNSAVHAAIVN
jgi:hypothetical protein